jgi:hypothetical protein
MGQVAGRADLAATGSVQGHPTLHGRILGGGLRQYFITQAGATIKIVHGKVNRRHDRPRIESLAFPVPR